MKRHPKLFLLKKGSLGPALERQQEALNREKEQLKKAVEDLQRERDILNKNFLKAQVSPSSNILKLLSHQCPIQLVHLIF